MKYLITLIVIFSATMVYSINYGNIYIPKNTENCLVLIEKFNIDTTGDKLYKPYGTGFIIKDTLGTNFIITNRHVFINRKEISVRFNYLEKNKIKNIRRRCTLIDENGKYNWIAHSDTIIDLALISAPANISYYYLSIKRIKMFNDVELGDPVLFLGFPLANIFRSDINTPLARSGIVSFKTHQDMLSSDIILLDAVSMGGNSGSPVLSSPKKDDSNISIIGVISGHINMENSNLGICIPADRILELIDQYYNSPKEE